MFKKNREIALDTETTGLNCENGDRIVEIGCVELINHIPTENTYHVYINPERPMHPDAAYISGITDDFLQDKPVFSKIADDFLNFVSDSTLVIHNAPFDIGFLNSELQKLDKPLFKLEEVVDTLDIARKKFPRNAVNLDALCRKFGVSTAERVKHGALIDAKLLGEVYIHLLGGKQSGLEFGSENIIAEKQTFIQTKSAKRFARTFKPSEEEIAAHREFLKTMESPIWNKILN